MDLEEIEFKESKPNTDFTDNYLHIVNFLKNERKKKKMPISYVAKAFECSKAKISLFENNKVKNFEMLNNFAGLLGYRLNLQIENKTYSQKR